MNKPKFSKWRLAWVFLILGLLILSGCSLLSSDTSGNENTVLLVTGPKSGRDQALNTIRDEYGFDLPFGENAWTEKNITPDGVETSAAYEYTTADWVVSIIYRVVDPVDRIYRVTVTNATGFSWEGEVEASGKITEKAVTYEQSMSEVKPSPTPAPADIIASTPTPTQERAASLSSYRDDRYRLKFQYPSSWNLSTLAAGRNIGFDFAAKRIELALGDIKLVIQYKSPWEQTVMEEVIPGGDIEIRRLVNLLGYEYPMKFVVENGDVIYEFLSANFEDLEFLIHLETNAEAIPEEVQAEAELIVASIIRSGDPLPTPTLSPTPGPIPTKSLGSTRSGSGTGSSVSEDCNKASFVAHVSVSEGAVMFPGVRFTKIWRLKNVGVCSWTKDYTLAYSTGDLMGADKRVNLPEVVPPGSTVDIEVEFTAPEKEGSYEGYWILNDAHGYWFGLGEQKKGFIPVKIIVVKPDDDEEYNFAIHYCDATWQNKLMEDDQELPCPGSSSSSKGFVILLANPQLESRNEDQLTLWVHPNEERYGWIRGTYPTFKVKGGDRFRAWVGCMADSEKCSLEFFLDYQDDDDDIFNLESWVETFDGKITKIDLDLSTLAGKSVKFILRTKALTKNVSAAQGFWFVPHIHRP
jgi:hypothetical protein